METAVENAIKTILLIDDDSEEHELFSEALKRYNSNITCLTAFNCLKGYELARQKKPDVIFVDMNLPGTDGLACLRKLKKTKDLRNVTVYIYSGGAVTNKDIHTALEEGAKKWIKKPDSFEDYDKMFATQIN
jgi:CheY-like chemotaxis protein